LADTDPFVTSLPTHLEKPPVSESANA
jgi:hypothetical protein